MSNEHLTQQQRELADAAKKQQELKRKQERNRRLNTDAGIQKRTDFDPHKE